MLCTFKAERHAQPGAGLLAQLPVCRAAHAGTLATQDGVAGASCDALDEAARGALAQVPPAALFPREPAPWLDWALGELGEEEAGSNLRTDSNPRVISYLEAGGLAGEFGDATDWCGGFVAWVLARHNGERPDQALPAPPTPAVRAAAWEGWAQPRDPSIARPGDIVVVRPDPAKDSRHVAFVLQADAVRVQVVGGNQSMGSPAEKRHGVTVTSFPLAQVVAVRGPA